MVDFPIVSDWEPEPLTVDLLVLSAGFEPRVCAFPAKLVEVSQGVIPAILVGQYQTNPEDNARRYTDISPLLKKFAGVIHEVDADVPEDILRAIIKLSESMKIERVAFDISGASSNFIFSVIGSFAQKLPHVELTVLYAEAASYNQSTKVSENRDEPREIPEHGVANVWNNAIFQGLHQDAAGSHIIAFPSLYLSRLARCLNFCGEAVESLAERNVHWVLPFTDSVDHKWRHDATIEVIKRLVATPSEDTSCIGELNSETQVDCHIHSPDQAARLVLKEAEARPGENIYLVHMGSKLQAIGAALALAARSEISLVHARPDKFVPEAYSDGIGQMHIFKIPSIGKVVRSMASIGQMVLVCADGTEEC